MEGTESFLSFFFVWNRDGALLDSVQGSALMQMLFSLTTALVMVLVLFPLRTSFIAKWIFAVGQLRLLMETRQSGGQPRADQINFGFIRR